MNRHPAPPRAQMARGQRMNVHAFHIRTGLFYHDNDQCPFGRGIQPESRIDGTGGLNECIMCRRLNSQDHHPTKI